MRRNPTLCQLYFGIVYDFGLDSWFLNAFLPILAELWLNMVLQSADLSIDLSGFFARLLHRRPGIDVFDS